ncbi:AMP-binding protein [Prauserella flavalba]|uniref:AMP-binding protein n=1 Tax=Prauserella flavalba TaxID=1477506 RepID=UPI0011B785A4|nr:AMP-binding protein [Prauserella flavalba]
MPVVASCYCSFGLKATHISKKSDVTLLTWLSALLTMRCTGPAERGAPIMIEPLVDRFRRLVSAAPDAPAVRDDRGLALTRQALWEEAGRVAAELAGHGVAAGDVVLQCLPNRVGWQVVFLGCLRLGAVPATLPTITPAETVTYICDLIGARALVAARHGAGTAGEAAVAAARASGRPVTVGLVDDGERTWYRADSGERAPTTFAHLMFTSSTTGMPKAVAHTESTLGAVNAGFVQRFGIDTQRPIFMASPLGHSVGAWHGGRLSLFTGAELVLQERWEPALAVSLIREHRCGFTAAATPFLKDLLDQPGMEKLGGLRTFLCGGAPVPPALVDQAAREAPGTFVSVLWGMTEGGVTTCVPGDPLRRVRETAGTGLPGLDLRTLGPPGGEGELVMRGPGVFVDYLGQPELYRDSLTPEGFFRTGDLAVLDPDGYVRITGRLKDLIIRGGINISPLPLENALSAHPAVRRVAVIGVPDERLGERICAVVQPDEARPDLDGLCRWLAERNVPRRHWPERLWFVDEMPQTAAGKIRKVELRNRLAKECR